MGLTPRLPRGVTPDPVGPGQVSVWSFPRPPIVVPDPRLVCVSFGGREICRTTRAVKVLETSHPPTWYLPVDDFADGALRPAGGRSLCEYKGEAGYVDLVSGDAVAARAAWGYPRPWPGFEELAGRVALYVRQVDSVTVAGEQVRAQPGGFYGGWITNDVAGPFKGAPGTLGW